MDFILLLMIFNIQRFSTHDGQGIRTMIFYKGCPLRCQWCCNPESQTFGPSLMFDSRLCKSFGDCLKTGYEAISKDENGIKIKWSSVTDPQIFRDVCATRALIVSGEEKKISEILSEIEKDLPFYKMSNGGVTLSGGEPLSQDEELVTLLCELNLRSIKVSIETSLHVPWEMIERCIGLTDTFLADLKHTDSEKFNRFTGGEAELVLKNLVNLTALHSNVIIRVPVIPDFNHTADEMKSIIDFAASLKTVSEIHFLPFHNLGSEKYRMLGMEYFYKDKSRVDVNELTEYIDYAHSAGLIAKTGG
jgi:pyruvate formate lyase activating enzyme